MTHTAGWYEFNDRFVLSINSDTLERVLRMALGVSRDYQIERGTPINAELLCKIFNDWIQEARDKPQDSVSKAIAEALSNVPVVHLLNVALELLADGGMVADVRGQERPPEGYVIRVLDQGLEFMRNFDAYMADKKGKVAQPSLTQRIPAIPLPRARSRDQERRRTNLPRIRRRRP